MAGGLSGDLHESLLRVADAMRAAGDPWWVIASAAMALHGAHPIEVADIDLLTSERDAERLIAALGIAPEPPGGTPLFRSALFARWTDPPVPVEIMAGFQVHTPQGWHSVRPATRIAHMLGGRALFIPSAEEVLDHCRLFDRPKDRERAALMQRLIVPLAKGPSHA